MPPEAFHNEPFDEGTLTKLRIFELYAREWLPVFLAPPIPKWGDIHLFDFFAGPGTDSEKEYGSPLRLLRQLRDYQTLTGCGRLRIHVHFFDKSAAKVRRLLENIDGLNLRLPNVTFDIRPLSFEAAFEDCGSILADPAAAKLVFIDQFGVDHVTTTVFRKLVTSPTCDFLFFLASSTLNRFRDHPAIWLKVTRPDDYFHVHRAALDYYRGLLSDRESYFLAPFSIKKGANIYGLIFGSGHPLGIDKFLQVAWQQDEISGEADFDIGRENIRPGELVLNLEVMRPTKVAAFEGELEHQLRNGMLTDEAGVMRLCFQFGVKRQHSAPVLQRLRKEGVIDLSFTIPDIRRHDTPRLIRRNP